MAASTTAHAGGLRCSIGEVLVDNLRVGGDYSLRTLANLPLSITNTGDQPVVVRVDVVVPGADELRYGAAALPNVSWASALPDSFGLDPQETRDVELRLRIPDDPALCGRKFQVAFWSHTLPQPGDFVACGLSSRVIFSTYSAREVAGEDRLGGLSVSLLPSEVTVQGASIGRTYRLEGCLDRPLVVKNPSKEKVLVELEVQHPQESTGGLPDGCGDLLAFASVDLSPKQVELGPGEEKVISGSLFFPDGGGLSGRTLMGVVSARVIGRDVTTTVCARILACMP